MIWKWLERWINTSQKISSRFCVGRGKRERVSIVSSNEIVLFPCFPIFFFFFLSSFLRDRKKNKNLIRWTSHGMFFELRYWKKNSFSRGHLYVCNCIRKYGIMYSYMKFRNKTLICNFDDAIACVWPLLSRINYVPFFFFLFCDILPPELSCILFNEYSRLRKK